jgi:hypothetical protein
LTEIGFYVDRIFRHIDQIGLDREERDNPLNSGGTLDYNRYLGIQDVLRFVQFMWPVCFRAPYHSLLMTCSYADLIMQAAQCMMKKTVIALASGWHNYQKALPHWWAEER